MNRLMAETWMTIYLILMILLSKFVLNSVNSTNFYKGKVKTVAQ